MPPKVKKGGAPKHPRTPAPTPTSGTTGTTNRDLAAPRPQNHNVHNSELWRNHFQFSTQKQIGGRGRVYDISQHDPLGYDPFVSLKVGAEKLKAWWDKRHLDQEKKSSSARNTAAESSFIISPGKRTREDEGGYQQFVQGKGIVAAGNGREVTSRAAESKGRAGLIIPLYQRETETSRSPDQPSLRAAAQRVENIRVEDPTTGPGEEAAEQEGSAGTAQAGLTQSTGTINSGSPPKEIPGHGTAQIFTVRPALAVSVEAALATSHASPSVPSYSPLSGDASQLPFDTGHRSSIATQATSITGFASDSASSRTSGFSPKLPHEADFEPADTANQSIHVKPEEQLSPTEAAQSPTNSSPAPRPQTSSLEQASFPRKLSTRPVQPTPAGPFITLRIQRRISTSTMAPVRDPTSVPSTIKEIIQHLYDIQSQTHGFIPETQDLLVDKMADLTNSLAYLQRLTDPIQSPNNPIQGVSIGPEVVDYVDDGRNPDIYTREFVEAVQRGNLVLAGRRAAFEDFSQVYAKALKEGIGGVEKQVDRVMGNAGIEQLETDTRRSARGGLVERPKPENGEKGKGPAA